jgi:hypothetical protein
MPPMQTGRLPLIFNNSVDTSRQDVFVCITVNRAPAYEGNDENYFIASAGEVESDDDNRIRRRVIESDSDEEIARQPIDVMVLSED